jgi:ribosomal protein S6--L-glutamate ligase
VSQDKVILGSEEWCSFPELGIPTIKARVDSELKHLLYMPSILLPYQKKMTVIG